jgi:hypothetical protein
VPCGRGEGHVGGVDVGMAIHEWCIVGGLICHGRMNTVKSGWTIMEMR